jgi:hypothetical protein
LTPVSEGTWTPALLPYLQQARHQQLFLAKMQQQKPTKSQPRLGKRGRRRGTDRPAAAEAAAGMVGNAWPWAQPPLFEVNRDFAAFNRRRHANFTNPWLIRAQREAQSWGLDHEEHLQPGQGEGLHRQEITRERCSGLGG